MAFTLRRLLRYLPPLPGGGAQYVRASWHKPSPYDEWRSQPPFRPAATLRADHFGRSLRRRRLFRELLRWTAALTVAWVVVESARALALP